MKKAVVTLRNKIIALLYKHLLKRIYFRIDPERVHDAMTTVGRHLGNYAITRALTRVCFGFTHPSLEQTILGVHFKNPVGLAAGFDKDAVLTDIIGSVGFGFAEVGSITGHACKGNPKPRLWRMKKSKGLVVYYGLKNAGCDAIATRLAMKRFSLPIGTSIAMTNDASTATQEAGIADYVKAFTAFTEIGDYFTINISCPNTCMGEPFTEPTALDKLLSAIDAIKTKKPVFLKLAADLTTEKLDAIIAVTDNHRVHGFICTNLTKDRGNENIKDTDVPAQGGMSGALVKDRSDAMISYLYKKTNGRYVIIGCGGIFSAQDAYEKICRGASLLQLITGMIFEGPQLISTINAELTELLTADGYTTISEAVGSKHRIDRTA